MSPRMPGPRGPGSSPAASTLRRGRARSASASTPRPIAACLDEAPEIPVRVVAKPVVTTPEGIAAVLLRGRRRRRLHRRHRVDAHVLAGQDVDRRPQRPAQAARPPSHAVQPRSPVGGDRHGLHEPPPVRARRPRVRVHPDAAAARPQDGRRPLAGPAGLGATRLVGAGRGRLARVAPAPDRAVRRQHARGRGHRRRQGRGAGPARVLGQRLRRRRPGRARRRRSPRPRSTASSTRTPPTTSSRRALRPGGDRHAELRDGGPDRGRPAVVPRARAGSARSPTRSRTSARSRSCRASASSG